MSGLHREEFAIPGIDHRISRIGFGGAAAGGHGWGARDDDQCIVAVRTAAEAGITMFDTADVYGLGHSEELIRLALGAELDNVVLATKGGVRWDASGRTWRDSSPTYIVTAAENSLRRLRLESIPLYYLHWQDGITPLQDSVEALNILKKQGKIRTFGLSNVAPSDLTKFISSGISAVQIKGNLLEPEEMITMAQVLVGTEIPLITYSSLADGLLTGKFTAGAHFGEDDHRSRYPLFRAETLPTVLERIQILRAYSRQLGRSLAQVAIRWLLDAPGVSGVLCGAKNPAQIMDQVGTVGWNLPLDIHQELSQSIPIALNRNSHKSGQSP